MTENIITADTVGVKEETALPSRRKKRRKPITVGKIVCIILLAAWTLFLVLPLYVVIVTSFTSSQQLADATSFTWFPKPPTVEGFTKVFMNDVYMEVNGIPSIILGFINTMWMTLIPLCVGLLTSALAAYSFSKIRFKGKEKLFMVEIALMVCPLGAFGIVSYAYYALLGWTGKVLPVIIPGMFGSFGTIFFLRAFMDGLPDAMVESAKIDGCGFFGIFFKIIFPLSKPALIAQFIFGFIGGYNSYLTPLLYLDGQENMITLSLVLANVYNIFEGVGYENIYCATAIIGMLPLIVVYCFLQKFFIEGIAVGSVKG